MEDRTERTVRLVLEIALIALTAIIASPIIQSWYRGASPPALSGPLLLVVLIVAIIFGAASFPARRVRAYFSRDRGMNAQAAPPDLSRELRALAVAGKRLWASESDQRASLRQQTLNVTNQVNQRFNGKSTAQQQLMIQSANGVVTGWRSASPLEESTIAEMDSILQGNGQIHLEAFRSALYLLRNLSLAGAKTAQSFTSAINGAQLVDLESYVRKEWGQFAGVANRFTDDLRKLGEKVKAEYGWDESYYIPPVDDI